MFAATAVLALAALAGPPSDAAPIEAKASATPYVEVGRTTTSPTPLHTHRKIWTPRRPDATGTVRLSHREVYELKLTGFRNARSDASVRIDGRHVGTFRIEKGVPFLVVRPVGEDGRLTFFRAGSREAQTATRGPVSAQGVVEVVFTPEAGLPNVKREDFGNPRHPRIVRPYGPIPATVPAYGATGLTLKPAERLQLDPTRAVVVRVRLADVNAPRGRQIYPDVRPLP